MTVPRPRPTTSRDPGSPRSTAPVEGALVVDDGARLHHRTVGPPGASPVVVLHGIMGHSREWDDLVARLAAHHRVTTIDQRGHGRSSWGGPYEVERMAADVAAVCEHLDLSAATLVGHSMGGMVGLVLAEQRPDLVGHLVLVDVAPGTIETPLAAELAAWLPQLAEARYATVDEALAEWLDGDPFARPDLLRGYVAHCLVADDEGRLRWRFDGHGLVSFITDGVRPARLWQAIDAVEQPTLLVRGRHSPAVDSDAAAEVLERLGRGALAEVDDAAHDLGVQQPEAVADAVLAFVSRSAAPVGAR